MPNLRLQTTIILLVCSVVIIALLVTYLLIGKEISERTYQHLEEKATDISRMVANSPVVINGMEGDLPEREIQTFAEDIREVTDVDYVVVFDMNSIRKSHPDEEKIGKSFVGGDEAEVLKGKEHVSIAKGTLGMSLRSFTPIYNSDESKQIGAVAVGISLSSIEEAVSKSRYIIYIGILFGAVIGGIGAILLGRRVRKILFGLEPSQIAKVFEERNKMLQSTVEGILTIDEKGTITLANDTAEKIFKQAGLQGDLLGENIGTYLDDSKLMKVIQTGSPELDQETNLNGIALLANIVPIKVEGRVVGAISTFRDLTEIKRLAEELTGVRMYAEALRAQAHEFKNKLHVILGMVHMKSYEQLPTYISQITNHYQEEIGFIAKRIKDPVLAGFVLAKMSYAREQSMHVSLSSDTFVPMPREEGIIHEIITIVGNLIDNALEAVKNAKDKKILVSFVFDEEEDTLTIEVKDKGTGMSDEKLSQVFRKGYSTKDSERGYGLHLVDESIQKLNGEVQVTSEPGKGTIFEVRIPYESKDENDD
ncbi:DcuS/MalK family sensor histidine kinase [Alkalihalobacillus sp. EGI L200015]|nr:DcuS/MalK family sensor histidine kinase [Pseudalkalibacillus salsuginis]MCF6410253.1 DcuS/MalK family sensor histidine kinase [Pseudalkalibacillus salsuginis]